MTAFLALPRLLWRPAMLWMLFPLFWAVAFPLIVLAESGAPLRALWSGEAAAGVRAAAWRLTALVPAAVGFAVAFPRLELQHATFSWTLPGVRAGLLAGTLLVGISIAGAAALVLGRAAPLSFTVAALAVGFFWFVAGSVVADAALPRLVRWALVLAGLLAVVRPVESTRLLDAWPWLSALLAVGMGAALLAAQFSRRSSRARHFLWSSAAPGATALYWAGRKGIVRDWTHSLATERFGPWVRAAAYEGSGGHALSFPARHLFLAAFAVLWAHLMNEPAMAIMLAGIFLSTGQIHLVTTLPYPLPRVRRAHVALAGATMEAVTLTAFMAVLVVGMQAAAIPVLGWFAQEEPSVTWGAAVGMAWAFAPVAQWVSIRWPIQRQPPAAERRFLPWFAAIFVYGVMAAISARALTGMSPLALAAAVLGIGAALHGVLWIVVHRHFARSDLL
jgi:hypothetical protein